jgi:ferric-dicitrate binding protein FerR (iron transport regulator)
VAFGPGERTVKLVGEAYFDVASDPDRPFVIETNGYSITALGTAFNVSTYTDDTFLETTLVEGTVEVEARQGEIISLNPGQSMRIEHESQEYELQDVDTRFYTSWKDGVLHFNKVFLSELCVKLERWYDAEILFSDPEKGKLVYSGALENSRSLEYLLNLIEQTADVRFVMEKSTIRVE